MKKLLQLLLLLTFAAALTTTANAQCSCEVSSCSQCHLTCFYDSGLGGCYGCNQYCACGGGCQDPPPPVNCEPWGCGGVDAAAAIPKGFTKESWAKLNKEYAELVGAGPGFIPGNFTKEGWAKLSERYTAVVWANSRLLKTQHVPMLQPGLMALANRKLMPPTHPGLKATPDVLMAYLEANTKGSCDIVSKIKAANATHP